MNYGVSTIEPLPVQIERWY